MKMKRFVMAAATLVLVVILVMFGAIFAGGKW